MRKHICKDCIYLCYYCGRYNKKGRRIISHYFCNCVNCNNYNHTITKFPKQCKYKIRKDKVNNND